MNNLFVIFLIKLKLTKKFLLKQCIEYKITIEKACNGM